MFAAVIDSLAGASTAELDTLLADAKRARDEADMHIAAVTAVVDSRQLFQDHGHRAVTGYLQQQLNCSPAEARRIKARARLVNTHPDIGDALGESRIGVEAVTKLADAARHPRAGDRFDEFAALLTEQAEQLDYTDFATAVKHFIHHADPDGSFNDHEFHNDQRTATARVDNGAISLHAAGGDPIRAVEMHTIFERAVDAETRKDFDTRRRLHGDNALEHPLPRTAEQRRFDAIYEIFVASTIAPADGKRPEPVVNLIIDINTGIDVLARHGLLHTDGNSDNVTGLDPSDAGLESDAAGTQDLLSRHCRTSTGVAVHPDHVLAAMVHGHIRRVVVDAHNVIIDMGRKQRLFTGNARQAAQLLATTCGHRGCNIAAQFCDIDHIDEWANHHGHTNQTNALPLCGTHDRHKHRQQLRGRRDTTGRIHLIKPDGTVIKTLNTRDPHWATPPPAPRTEPTDDPSQTEPSDCRVDLIAYPTRHTTWAELTQHTTTPRRPSPPPDATVELIDLTAA